MSKYVIRKIKVDGELVDLYAQAFAGDVKFSINKGNNVYEDSTVQAVLEQIGLDIKQIKEDMEFISSGGSTVVQPINYGGTGATNTTQAALNLQVPYLGSIPYGVEAMAFVTEETIDSLTTPGTYRYMNSGDIGSVTIKIQPINIFTNTAIGNPFQESASAYSIVNMIVTEDSYTVEGFALVENVNLVVNVFSDDVTVKVPYHKITDLTYTVKWFVEIGLGTGKYELLTQVTRGGSGYDEGDVVTVTDADKVIEGYYAFDINNTNNVLSTTLVGDTDNVLKLYFNAIPEPVYTGYTIKVFNAATGEELTGTFTVTLTGEDNTETTISTTYPQVESNTVTVGTTITINPKLTLNSETRTYNYKSSDDRNITTLTMLEDSSSNIFKLYYEKEPVYTDVIVRFYDANLLTELTGTFEKCKIYDYSSTPTSLGQVTIPITFTAEVGTTVNATSYENDLFDTQNNIGYIYQVGFYMSVISLEVSETKTNELKLYFNTVSITPDYSYVEYNVEWKTESGTLLPIFLKNPNPETRIAIVGDTVELTETDKASINDIEPISYSDNVTITEDSSPITLSVVFPDSVISEEVQIAAYGLNYSSDAISLSDEESPFDSEPNLIMLDEGTLYVSDSNTSNLITQIFIGNLRKGSTSDELIFGIAIRISNGDLPGSSAFTYHNWDLIYPVQEGGLSEVTPDDFTGILPVANGGTGADNLGKFALLNDRTGIPSNADLNEYINVGSYYSIRNTSNIANKPTDINFDFALWVFQMQDINTLFINQCCFSAYDSTIWFRLYNKNTKVWSKWEKTYSSRNKPDSLTDGTNTYKIGQDSNGVYIEIT